MLIYMLMAFSVSGSLQESEGPTWKDLSFNGDSYRIMKMEVSLEADISASWQKGVTINEKDKLKPFEITDESTLRYLERTLFQVHKIAVDPKKGWVGPYQKVGRIKLTTNKGAIEIGISNAGFVLGSADPTQHNIFYSWALAKIVEREHNKQFDKRNFDILAGLFFAKDDQELFEKLNTAQGKENGAAKTPDKFP